MKTVLSLGEPGARLADEIEAIANSAEAHVEDAAYWWEKIVGTGAEVVGQTLQVVIGPSEVHMLISALLWDRLEQCQDEPDRLAALWTQRCSDEAHVHGYGLLVEDDE
jgi:hypothetical protein